MVDELVISDTLSIPLEEIEMTAVRSSGAGGQNVNKVATAIHLRFDAANSASLPEDVRRRLLERADQRITDDGVVVIKARESRRQQRNREVALRRLAELLREATVEEKPRHATRPSYAARQRRRDDKRRRGRVKSLRGRIRDD